MKTGQILRHNDTPVDEAAHNRTYPRMDNQLGSDKDRKTDEESNMHLNIVKEGKPTDVPSRGTDGGQEQQWKPCDQHDYEQPAM
jgi:hypothetical protein